MQHESDTGIRTNKRDTQTQTGGAGGGTGAGGPGAGGASAATASATCEDFRRNEFCEQPSAWSTSQLEHMHASDDNGLKNTGALIIHF